MPLGMEVRLGPGSFVFDGDPVTPEKRHPHLTQFLANVYCGQTAGWIKMPLLTDVNLGPGDGLPYAIGLLSVSVCLSVRLVHCGETVGWIKMTWY